jgi:glycogen phosphorylase
MFVSVTPEIGLDEYQVLAGGLGVLEGDKFYSAAKAGVNYTVLTPLYRGGYAEYEQAPGSSTKRATELARSLTGTVLVPEQELEVKVGSFGKVTIRPMRIERGSAKVIYLDAISP